MGLNPFHERGIPLEKQFRNWSEPNVKPYDKNSVAPYTQCRVITMNGIEVESVIFSHQFARHTTDMDLKRQLAMVRGVEQQQQKAINWLTPRRGQHLEVTIGCEQVAVDLTPWVAGTSRDDVRNPLKVGKSNPISLLHALTVTAAEQQTMNFYMNMGNRPLQPLARGLYLEIAMIEEQHVSH